VTTDARALTAYHEASHAVAAFILGRDLYMVEVPTSGSLGGKAAGRCTTMATLRDLQDDPIAAEAEAVVCFAGGFAMEALGLTASGTGHDEHKAAEVAVWGAKSADDAIALHDRARRRARRLVDSERFQDLALRLLEYLLEPGHSRPLSVRG
jgi:hypothetical protein